MASFSLITYNVWNGRALPHVPELLTQFTPDVLCLQEFPIDPEAIAAIEACGYTLAEYSSSFAQKTSTYGIATFYNPYTIAHSDSDVIRLRRTVPETVLMASRKTQNFRTVLQTRLHCKQVGIGFDVYNTHLSFHGNNKARLSQLKKVLELTDESGKIPSLIVGDLNYVYRRSILEKLIFEHGVFEASQDILWTVDTTVLGFWHLQMKPDYIFYKGKQFRVLSAQRIEETQSDHHPVLAVFSLTK